MADLVDQDLLQAQLEKLNACHMLLQVTTLAEIMDHTGLVLLPQVLTSYCQPIPTGLHNISQSTLHWPQIHPPSAACWCAWTSTICLLYTGSAKGQQLTSSLGAWLPTHGQHCFWHWRMHDATHLVYCSSLDATTHLALPILSHHTSMKFSPTIPTRMEFKGPSFTPSETLNVIPLPVTPFAMAQLPATLPLHFSMISETILTRDTTLAANPFWLPTKSLFD